MKNWLYNVAATGTFYKAEDVNDWPTGASGIPSGWTVEDHINDYAAEYFTIESLEDNNTITLTIGSGVGPVTLSWVAWSKDKTNWTTTYNVSGEVVTIIVDADKEKVYWKGSGVALNSGGAEANTSTFMVTKLFNVSGNIASLVNGDDFAGVTGVTVNHSYRSFLKNNTTLVSAKNLVLPFMEIGGVSCFNSLFSGCSGLIEAPELPATTLGDYCYTSMFNGCTSLEQAPALPATTMANYCYNNMFRNCTSLQVAPELPATTLADYCYSAMFQNCTALLASPKLPATTLATRCYNAMFYGCTSLIEAGEILATTVADYCCSEMYRGCSSLVKAPRLKSVLLVDNCYKNMFNGCTTLNEVTCLATDISAADCTTNWLYNVATTGTFHKNEDMNAWPTGISGIPSGWTVEDEPIATPAISYDEPSITFTVTEPKHFFAYFTPNLFTQESTLAQGWNWWAPMVQAPVADIEAALGDTLLQVKPQNDPLGENLAMGEMYRIQTTAPCNLPLTGIRLSSATVSIAPGNNWFGYTGNAPATIATVFGSTFGPTIGDKIIAQDEGFAIYNGTAWEGTLTTLQPGHGYVYVSNASGTKTVVFE